MGRDAPSPRSHDVKQTLNMPFHVKKKGFRAVFIHYLFLLTSPFSQSLLLPQQLWQCVSQNQKPE